MKSESHLHLDVTVPFVWKAAGNELQAPHFLQQLIYPKVADANPIAAFLENVSAPSNIRINIHISVGPT
jgi:hypothetical protein